MRDLGKVASAALSDCDLKDVKREAEEIEGEEWRETDSDGPEAMLSAADSSDDGTLLIYQFSSSSNS